MGIIGGVGTQIYLFTYDHLSVAWHVFLIILNLDLYNILFIQLNYYYCCLQITLFSRNKEHNLLISDIS